VSLNWYTLSIIALFFIGLQRFLYKVSVQRGCNAAVTTFTFMGTVTCISFVLLLFSDAPLGPISFLVFISLVNSISFTSATLTNLETLKYLPVNVAYPIIRLNLAVVVIFSVLFFGDALSAWQIAGIFVAICAILILAKSPDANEAGIRNLRRGFVLLSICVLSGAVASISSKFAVMETNKLAFITLSYFFGTSFAFTLRNRVAQKAKDSRDRDAIIIGICMAILNLIGFYLFLLALDRGPLSVVVSIISLHFVIPIVLSALFYSEKLKKVHFVGIGLTVVSVIFLRM
jgi:drug/metabolite transporter (DMT)-like permease